jgi:elongation factor Ts
MADISASAVKSLRDKTGLPMMECKQALQSTGGDEAAAIDMLRKQGKKTMANRADRETSFGRFGVYADVASGVGALVELRCESAPVVGSNDFIQLANDLAKQLATGPGAATGDELLSQPSPSRPGQTLADQKDDLVNRIREVFNIGRMVRIDGPCGGYAHHTGTHGALVEVRATCAKAIDQSTANELAMHVTAMRPKATTKDDLDPALIDKEREILSEASRKEGKPENIIAKMVEGRLRNFFAEHVLAEQPFIKDEKKTVGAYANDHGMQVVRFVGWELGKE